MSRRDPWRAALALLLVASAVLFAVGTTLEHGEENGHDEPAVETHDESEAEAGRSEDVVGVDVESPALVGLGVVASLALAAGVWFVRRPEVVPGAGLFALVFLALDVREVMHQLDESNTRIALLAGLIGLLHAGAAAVAAGVYRTERRPAP